MRRLLRRRAPVFYPKRTDTGVTIPPLYSWRVVLILALFPMTIGLWVFTDTYVPLAWNFGILLLITQEHHYQQEAFLDGRQAGRTELVVEIVCAWPEQSPADYVRRELWFGGTPPPEVLRAIREFGWEMPSEGDPPSS